MLYDKIRRALREMYFDMQQQMHGWNDDPPIERVNRRKNSRLYIYSPAEGRSKRRLVFCTGAVLAGVFVYSAVQLIAYGADYASARRASNTLREAYYEPEETQCAQLPEETAPPAATPTLVPAMTAEQAVPTVTNVPATTVVPVQRLPQVPYPNNAHRIISSRFQKLKRQNSDIIGWLTIDGMIDEAVVQRNNEYYLTRDYRGYHNVNGAIFLDENCDLRTRPYTLMLYGHNMKSGLMFGGLRNYENPTYYHNNPFITFDTAYEDGRYVVFSVATISLDAANWRFVNLSWLISSSASLRGKAISSLNRFSVYDSRIDVQPEDQLLLLITCVDEQTDRRIVTARRIRDGETEADLLKQVKQIRKK